MLVNLESAQVIKSHGHHHLVLDIDGQFDENTNQSLSVQDLLAKQQNPSFLAIDEEDLQMLSTFDASGAAKDKQAALWAKITGDQSSGKWPSQAKIMLEGMGPTFEAPGDEMPSGRTKYIHSVGVTGKVRFVKKGDTDYSGIFQGADHGIVRFSSAAEPSSSQALAPGMGLKFLRDGQDSANLVAMFDTAGQPGNWNFFGNDFTTHIPPAKGALLVLATKFATYTNFIQSVGMSDFARYNQAGDMYKDPKFPFSLRFAPHRSVKDLFPTKLSGSDFGVYVDQLKTVKDDSKLYKVYAMDQPAELGGKESYIGDLVLDGALHSSKWGDESLFFRHQNMKDDLKLQPSWEKYTDKFFKLPFTNLAEKCPFGYS